jgi:hypothetical protein
LLVPYSSSRSPCSSGTGSRNDGPQILGRPTIRFVADTEENLPAAKKVLHASPIPGQFVVKRNLLHREDLPLGFFVCQGNLRDVLSYSIYPRSAINKFFF